MNSSVPGSPVRRIFGRPLRRNIALHCRAYRRLQSHSGAAISPSNYFPQTATSSQGFWLLLSGSTSKATSSRWRSQTARLLMRFGCGIRRSLTIWSNKLGDTPTYAAASHQDSGNCFNAFCIRVLDSEPDDECLRAVESTMPEVRCLPAKTRNVTHLVLRF